MEIHGRLSKIFSMNVKGNTFGFWIQKPLKEFSFFILT